MRVNPSCRKQITAYIHKPGQNASCAVLYAPEKEFVPLNKDFFNSYLTNFKGIDRSPENFEVKRVYGLECPCCGQVMLTKKQVHAFTSRVGDKRGEDLQKELLKERVYYRKTEGEIADSLIELSKRHPELDLKRLVILKREESVKRLEKEQKKILEQIKEDSKKLPPEERESVLLFTKEAKECIDNSNDDIYFKRKLFIEQLKEINTDSNDTKQQLDKIIETAEKIPSSHTSTDAFFVKYSRRENKEIASRLVLPSLITTEHVKPQSNDGANNTENYIPLCGECNSKRGNMPYNIWFQEHPEMPENLQKFINEIDRLIKNGEFQGFEYYETYVEDVISAIKEATGGALVLKVPSSEDIEPEDDIEEDTEQELTIEEQRAEWIDTHDKKHKTLICLEEKREALKDDEEYCTIASYVSASKQLKDIRTKTSAKQSELALKNRKLRIKEELLNKSEKEDNLKESPDELREAIERLRLEIKNGQSEYEVMAAQARELSEYLKQLKQAITTPEEIQEKIIKLKKRLDELQRTKSEIRTIKNEISDEDELIIEAGLINSEIAERKAANNRLYESIDTDSKENQQIEKEYKMLKRQLELIENVDLSTFRSAFSDKKISPDFILEDSKNALLNRMNALLQSPMAQYLKGEDEIKTLELKSAKIKETLNGYDTLKRKCTSLQQKAKQIKNGASESQLRSKLETLLIQKVKVSEKFQLVDIDEKIEQLRKECNDLLQKYSESFETTGY